MALIDYLGFRLVAMSLLPIDEQSIKFGSSDAGSNSFLFLFFPLFIIFFSFLLPPFFFCPLSFRLVAMSLLPIDDQSIKLWSSDAGSFFSSVSFFLSSCPFVFFCSLSFFCVFLFLFVLFVLICCFFFLFRSYLFAAGVEMTHAGFFFDFFLSFLFSDASSFLIPFFFSLFSFLFLFFF